MMGSLTWTEPASYEGTITTLYVLKSNGSTIYIIPDFSGAQSPLQLDDGDRIHVQYRHWDDRKHGWGPEQTAELDVVNGSSVNIDVMADEPFIVSGSSGGQPAGDDAPRAAMLFVVTYPGGATITLEQY